MISTQEVRAGTARLLCTDRVILTFSKGCFLWRLNALKKGSRRATSRFAPSPDREKTRHESFDAHTETGNAECQRALCARHLGVRASPYPLRPAS